jgi:hypothetical protein
LEENPSAGFRIFEQYDAGLWKLVGPAAKKDGEQV